MATKKPLYLGNKGFCEGKYPYIVSAAGRPSEAGDEPCNQWSQKVGVQRIKPRLSCLYCPESGRIQVHIVHKIYPFQAICTQTAPELGRRLDNAQVYYPDPHDRLCLRGQVVFLNHPA